MGRLFTSAGYLFGEATSAMQKSIRRGWTDEALYWSHEIAARYKNYVWRRLSVIMNEDVGIGTPEIITAFWEKASVPNRPDLKNGDLADVVRMLCASRKTRLADRFLTPVWEQAFGWSLPATGTVAELNSELVKALKDRDEERALPYALALEPKDKQLWFTLTQAAAQEKDYPFAAQVAPVLQEQYDAFVKWKKKGWESALFFGQMILVLCRQPELTPLPQVASVPYDHVPDEREIPDVALDIHTNRGRYKMKRTVEDFFEQGMVVHPEAMEYATDYMDRFKAVCRAYEKAGNKIPAIPPAAPALLSNTQSVNSP